MEAPKAPETAPQPSNPPTTSPQSPPSTAATTPSSTTLPSINKKRPLESDAHCQNSNYFKIRAVVRDLRPRFIEVLQTPDYKNCNASHEIREQLKIVIKLHESLKEDVSLGKSKSMQEDHRTVQEQQHEKASSARPSEIKLTPPISGLQKLQGEDNQPHGSYVVGGSAFGWNFITFAGQDPVYYGKTKEQFRSTQVVAQ